MAMGDEERRARRRETDRNYRAAQVSGGYAVWVCPVCRAEKRTADVTMFRVPCERAGCRGFYRLHHVAAERRAPPRAA